MSSPDDVTDVTKVIVEIKLTPQAEQLLKLNSVMFCTDFTEHVQQIAQHAIDEFVQEHTTMVSPEVFDKIVELSE